MGYNGAAMKERTQRGPGGYVRGRVRLGSRRDWVAVLLLACGLVPYVLNVDAFFVSDDFVLLSWTRVGSLGDVVGFFDPNTEWFYRPVVKLVYWAGQGVFGFRAWPLHVLSLGLHLGNAYLLYRLVAGSRWGWRAGLAAGLVFMLDAHHAETVSWVAAVGDLLGTGCVLGNLLLLRRYVEGGKLRYAVAGLGLFGVGLLARETVLLLPGLAALYVVMVVRGGVVRRLWRGVGVWLAGYVAIAVGYLAVVRLGSSGGGGLARGGLEFRALNLDSVLLGVLDYAHRLVPGGEVLAAAPLDVLRWLVWVEWGVVVGVGVVLWRWRLRYALFGVAWLLVTPLAFVFFSGPTDRYFYLPSVGFAMVVGCLVGGLPALVGGRGRGWQVGVRAVAGLVLVGLLVTRGAGLASRVAEWRAAGHVAGGIVNDIRRAVPEPEDYAAFFFVDVPVFLEGVPVFQNGLQEAVQGAYGNGSIAAQATDCGELRGRVEWPRYSYFFRYKANGVTRLASQQECR